MRRHRGVPAAAAHAEQERRAHLLRGRAEVERPPAEHDPVAAALVDRVVGAHRVRVLADEPREPEVLADLLVGRGDEDEVAVRPEPLPRQARDRDRARRDLALHVERPAPPDLAVDDARPTTGRAATRPGRRARCRCGRGARASARSRSRGSARRGWRAPAPSRTARPRRPRPRGRRAAPRAARVSFPGGLTVSAWMSSRRSSTTPLSRTPSRTPSARSGPPTARGRAAA